MHRDSNRASYLQDRHSSVFVGRYHLSKVGLHACTRSQQIHTRINTKFQSTKPHVPCTMFVCDAADPSREYLVELIFLQSLLQLRPFHLPLPVQCTMLLVISSIVQDEPRYASSSEAMHCCEYPNDQQQHHAHSPSQHCVIVQSYTKSDVYT